MAEEVKMLATAPPCASPGVNGLPLPQLKRKRSHSSDSATDRDAPVATKLRPDDATNNATPSRQTSSSQEPTPTSDGFSHSPHRRQGSSSTSIADQATTPRKVNVEKLRETLEAQLSLEVLLKHNELRLIDQEIAKCQVAMEQLRRCAEIPYPGSNVAGLSQSVSNGTGIAVLPPGNGPAPFSPAPWGVADGPYTRHYAKWLIPDPRFDGGEFDPVMTPLATSATGSFPMMEGRSTRGNPSDGGYMASKSRPQRGSGGAKLQSLPTGYPPTKERAGPMMIRRKSDGVLVKLVCLDCRRDNFSSTQGFINHCRIAHNRNFASHDAAATASGEPVEVDDAGVVVGGKSHETPSVAAPGYVHPLVRSAHVIEPSATPSAQDVVKDATPRKQSGVSQSSPAVETPRPSAGRPRPGKRNTPGAVKASNDSFMASPATPHLSSLMQVRGVGVDLDQLVGEAKITVDLGAYSSEDAESDDDSLQPSTDTSQGSQQALGSRVGRQPMRTTVGQTASQRPNSRKGLDHMGPQPLTLDSLTPTRSVPYTSPYGPASSLSRPPQGDELREVDGMDHSANLSPNTLESNQAPSLVSDDDDFEVVSDSESPGPSSSEAGDNDQDFSHVDVEDDEDTTTSNGTADPKSDPGLASPATHNAAPLSKSLRRGNSKKKDRFLSSSLEPLERGKDEKRVGFVNPDSSPGKGKKDSHRKSR
ncbi:hypothetical protein ASPWEDRAFT_36341 [Aspergillus wentii DTO 134E9]|uniref:AHC1-like C2H2 zinc-finger domain-containing protein n=1 Tax=Aspergillus wentii DTO 134E9 TaxID=1073089 RepID=A0A1L9RUQ5_ASPWE|nr:uncharacterized protein ASPWEDRAFT_36341 [Aspergillus wentii DTO 134E9]OJJ38649.1 hypothetical protein ASPWEDRAFT_36341 [Aspergillus wentii DTO 134E9]